MSAPKKKEGEKGDIFSPDLLNRYSNVILRELEELSILNIGRYNNNNIYYTDGSVLIAR